MNTLKSHIYEYSQCASEVRSIRYQVFVDEQGVPKSLEMDGLDPEALHCLVFDNDIGIGTGRLLPDGHIGRVAVLKQYRGRGIGREIMISLIARAKKLAFPKVWLSSQYHAKGFYEKLGFVVSGSIYQEAGIDHIKMTKSL